MIVPIYIFTHIKEMPISPYHCMFRNMLDNQINLSDYLPLCALYKV